MRETRYLTDNLEKHGRFLNPHSKWMGLALLLTIFFVSPLTSGDAFARGKGKKASKSML